MPGSSPQPGSNGSALVTGASRGIGKCIVEALVGNGYRVAVAARSDAALQQLAQQHGKGLILPLATDLRNPDAVDAMVQQATTAFGSLEVLVNNAGTAPSLRFERTTDEILDEVLDLHVRAPFRLIRALLSEMKAQDNGCIVQLASTAGLRGFPFTAAYAAGKHGMVGMARALAAELGGSKVKIYAVCPGFVDTDITRGAAAAVASRGKTSADEALGRMAAMNDIGRMHQPQEVADVVKWLVRERPEGCVYNMDSEPPSFL